MSFFQNPFNQEFIGSMLFDDRQLNPNFKCPANKNTSNYQVAYNKGPWNLSSGNNLTINYIKNGEEIINSLIISLTGSNINEITTLEVLNSLNSNDNFNMHFEAFIQNDSIIIKQKINDQFKIWISNTGAEVVMGFNKHAGVAELPSYYKKNSLNLNLDGELKQLIFLDETDPVDINVIENAGFVAADMKDDWELLNGTVNGTFIFKKSTIDGSNRVTSTIEYPAGAKEGNLARKTTYKYSGTGNSPTETTEEPYVLTSSDLITP